VGFPWQKSPALLLLWLHVMHLDQDHPSTLLLKGALHSYEFVHAKPDVLSSFSVLLLLLLLLKRALWLSQPWLGAWKMLPLMAPGLVGVREVTKG